MWYPFKSIVRKIKDYFDHKEVYDEIHNAVHHPEFLELQTQLIYSLGNLSEENLAIIDAIPTHPEILRMLKEE